MNNRAKGTNGRLSIDEIIKRDSLIRKMLDKDEKVEYISYQKGKRDKIILFFLVMVLITLFTVYPLGENIISDLLFVFLEGCFWIFIFLLYLGEKHGKLVITNKGIIVRSFTNLKIFNGILATEKFNYSKIDKVTYDYEHFSILKLVIYNKKYLYKTYPILSNITSEEGKYLSDIIQRKLFNGNKKVNFKHLKDINLKNDKEIIINKVLDSNKEVKKSKTGTNGKMKIGEVLKQYHQVNGELAEGERIRYVIYKKSTNNLIIQWVFTTVGVFFLFGLLRIFSLLVYMGPWRSLMILILIIIYLIFFLYAYRNKSKILVFTNQSIVETRKSKKSCKKVFYRDIKDINYYGNALDMRAIIQGSQEKEVIVIKSNDYVNIDSYQLIKEIDNNCMV